MGRNWTPSIMPNGHDQNFYIVVNNYGKLGQAFAETASPKPTSKPPSPT
jgi:hypothetical protein